MKRIKLYPVLSAAAILVAVVAFDLVCGFLPDGLDYYHMLVTLGRNAYYSMVFSHPGVLTCLAAVLGTGTAAIVTDARAIRREERGALVLLILVSLALLVFAVLFWVCLQAL